MSGDISVSLLGAVRVDIGGVPLGLAPLPRAALARLALAPGRVISIETLIDALWGDAPPGSARTRVHALISSLRQALAARGVTDLIETRPPGYVLAADRADIDVLRFDAGLARARHALAGGEDSAAARELAAALALWSADALGGIECAFAEPARAELAERRLRAIDEKVRLDLRLRPPEDLVAELTGLVAAHPLRERLRGYLMVSLTRAGRQAEALASYRAYVRLLDERYGLEPGAELRRLHDAALADPGAAGGAEPQWWPAPVTAPPVPVPAALPLDVQGFSGRADALRQLDAVLASGGGQPTGMRIAVVSGAPGVGKTALAVHWAHQVAHRFPDGQLFLNLRGYDAGGAALREADAVRSLLDALGTSPHRVPASPDAQVALYRSLLADRRMLVLLDNARDAAQVRPLLPGAPGCLVVVTARDRLTGLVAATGAHPVPLGPLTADGARDLLAARLPVQEADAPALDRIVSGCAGLPLALVIAAARVRTDPQLGLPALAEEFPASGGRLDALSYPDPAVDVRAVFSWSCQTLTPAAGRLFRLLSVHPRGELSRPAAASIAGGDAADARALLGELTSASLLTEVASDRFGCHDLLREYAAELSRAADSGRDRALATRRLLDHYLGSAYAAAIALDPHRERIPLPPGTPAGAEPPDPLAWFTAEHSTLVDMVRVAAANGLDEYTWCLAWTLVDFLDNQGHWSDWITVELAALEAAERLGDARGQAYTHRVLGRGYVQLGRYQEARHHYEQALDGYARLGDQVGQAHTYFSLSWMTELQGRYREAIDERRRSLDLYLVAGHRVGQARALNALGWAYALDGDHVRALALCREALALTEEIGDRQGQAATWDTIGYAHHHLGERAEAVRCYRRALALYREAGDLLNQAEVLEHLGDCLLAADDGPGARSARLAALEILDQLRHPRADTVRAKLAARPGPNATTRT